MCELNQESSRPADPIDISLRVSLCFQSLFVFLPLLQTRDPLHKRVSPYQYAVSFPPRLFKFLLPPSLEKRESWSIEWKTKEAENEERKRPRILYNKMKIPPPTQTTLGFLHLSVHARQRPCINNPSVKNSLHNPFFAPNELIESSVLL